MEDKITSQNDSIQTLEEGIADVSLEEEIPEFHFQYDMMSDRQKYIKKDNEEDVSLNIDDIVNILEESEDDKEDIIDLMLNEDYVESTEYKSRLKNTDIHTCKECGSTSVYPQEDVGYMVCGECGEDNGNIRSNNKDWRATHKDKINFMQGNDRCNSTTSNNMPNAGPKMILKGTHSESLLAKIHKWSSVTYKNKNMWKIYKYMELRCKNLIETDRLTLQTVKDGFNVYQDVYNYQLFRGNIRKGVIASCVLYVAKNNGDDITEDELAEAFGINGSIILDGYKRLINILHRENLRSTYVKPSEAMDYINKFCEILNINHYGQQIIHAFVDKMRENKLATANNPKTQVTSCIFLASCIFDKEITNNDIHVTKRIIATKCKISEVTLYKCYTKLLENIDKLLDIDELTDKQKGNLKKLKNKRYKRRSKQNANK